MSELEGDVGGLEREVEVGRRRCEHLGREVEEGRRRYERLEREVRGAVEVAESRVKQQVGVFLVVHVPLRNE